MPRRSAFTAAVPPARKPAAKAVRKINGFTPVGLPSLTNVDVIEVDPTSMMFYVHPDTWKWVKNDPQVMPMLVHETSEAVRMMQTRMVDVGPYSPFRAADDRKPPARQAGIVQLADDLQEFVHELAVASTPEQVAACAKQYAKYRDAFAKLRDAFTQAEASFEVAQALLVAKMGDDE